MARLNGIKGIKLKQYEDKTIVYKFDTETFALVTEMKFVCEELQLEKTLVLNSTDKTAALVFTSEDTRDLPTGKATFNIFLRRQEGELVTICPSDNLSIEIERTDNPYEV